MRVVGGQLSLVKKPKPESFLSKVVSKLQPWRRISGPGFIRDVVNAAQRKLQDLVDTGVYVPRVTNVLTCDFLQ